MNEANYDIPDGLNELLLRFCVSAMEENPQDLFDFGVQFFSNLKNIRDGKQSSQHVTTRGIGGTASSYDKKTDSEDASSDDVITDLPLKEYASKVKNRRKSVSAEPYNPEEICSDSRVIIPKMEEQILKIKNMLKDVFIFKSLDQEQLSEVIEAMSEKRVLPQEYIIKRGEEGDYFYIIESGVFEVYVDVNGKCQKVSEYDNSGSFGELALLYNQPRSADILAKTCGCLWALDRSTFRRIVLKSAYKKRQMFDSFIKNVELFRNLTEYERMNICDALTTYYFEEGQTIIKQGDVGDKMYIIESGTVKISIHKNGEDKFVGLKNRGDFFGEFALIRRMPRSASAFAVGRVKLAALDAKAFERLLGPCVNIMKRTMLGYQM